METTTVADLRTKPTWTIDDVCSWFEISRDTLKRWRKSGEFPEGRVMPGGRLVRWDSAEIFAWFEELERAAA